MIDVPQLSMRLRFLLDKVGGIQMAIKIYEEGFPIGDQFINLTAGQKNTLKTQAFATLDRLDVQADKAIELGGIPKDEYPQRVVQNPNNITNVIVDIMKATDNLTVNLRGSLDANDDLTQVISAGTEEKVLNLAASAGTATEMWAVWARAKIAAL